MQKIKSIIQKRKILACLIAAVTLVTVVVSTLSLTAFAETTYVITDGDRITVHKTTETDPRKVLDQAGVWLHHTDRYVTQPSKGGYEITVQRAKAVTIDLRGEQMHIVSYEETVAQMFAKLDIRITKDDALSVKLSDKVVENMVVTVVSTTLNTETVEKPIPFETEYVYTNYLPKGKTAVLTEGTDGVAQCLADITRVNGKETDRKILSETTKIEPINRLIAVGNGKGKAKEGMPLVGQNKLLTWKGEVLEFTHKDEFKATCYYRFPVDGEITAMGTPTRVGAIAVDPKVIPYWTKMYIVTQDGEYIYGVAVAEDCGTAIKGKWVDLFLETYEEACAFGRRQVDIYFLA